MKRNYRGTVTQKHLDKSLDKLMGPKKEEEKTKVGEQRGTRNGMMLEMHLVML